MALPTRLATFLAALLLANLVACSSDDAAPAADANVTPDGESSFDARVEEEAAVPSEAGALSDFLQARSYTAFQSEPAIHASTGPHGQVRSYFNSGLAASLSANAESHPIGSGVIKELYNGTTLRGWAVMVKTADAGAASDWYYYEVFSISEGASPVADSNGPAGCANCHGGGTDYILTPFP